MVVCGCARACDHACKLTVKLRRRKPPRGSENRRVRTGGVGTTGVVAGELVGETWLSGVDDLAEVEIEVEDDDAAMLLRSRVTSD